MRQGANPVRRRLLFVLLHMPLIWAFKPAWANALPKGIQSKKVSPEFLDLLIRLGAPPAVAERLASRLWRLHVKDEPWGAHHLSLLLRAWPPGRLAFPDVSELDPGVRWYLGHLMTTLVTGIYYHERGSKAVIWDDALMHRWLADLRPVPGRCASSFGDWSRPPMNAG